MVDVGATRATDAEHERTARAADNEVPAFAPRFDARQRNEREARTVGGPVRLASAFGVAVNHLLHFFLRPAERVGDCLRARGVPQPQCAVSGPRA